MSEDRETGLGIELQPVESTNIKAIGFDPETSRMAVMFRDGGIYVYADVSPEHYEAFAGAESVGKHFHAHIRGVFASTKHVIPSEDASEKEAP